MIRITALILGLFLCVAGIGDGFPQSAPATLDRARFDACRNSRPSWLRSADKREMVECIKDLFSSAYGKLRTSRGLPSLGIPSLEPLFVDSATVRDSSVFTGTIRNLRVHGLSEGFLRQNIDVIPPDASGRGSVRLNMPRGITMDGDFDAVANILKSVLPFYSGPASRVSGLFEGSTESAAIVINARFVDDPQKGAKVDGIQLSFQFGRPHVQLRNEQLLSGTILVLLNNLLKDPDVARTVVNEVTPEVLKRFQDPVYNLLENGLNGSSELVARALTV